VVYSDERKRKNLISSVCIYGINIRYNKYLTIKKLQKVRNEARQKYDFIHSCFAGVDVVFGLLPVMIG